MLKTHEKFHSENGKRLILIVDDEPINRQLLQMSLGDTYESLQAGDGPTALQMIREHRDMLSLVLLDLLMPGMNGLDVLRTLKNDQELKDIPVIVMTADREAEVISLQLGAADFIPKPYPSREIIIARVEHAIELVEDRDTIHSTERDNLTGLYNREYFYHYAVQYDQHHPDADMDAMVIDVHHFRMINERYGKDYGDDILCRIGEKVREVVRESGGIVSRREADTFLVYCPHRDDYERILNTASIDLDAEKASGNRVRLRMGVYEHADRSIEIERRFDRAKMAADTIRGNFIRTIAKYDSELHESEIYTEQLLEEFPKALEERQFAVFYQPKFDIRSEIPSLASAEALVRWQHPEGMISPGSFIPLLEENGLIQKLDLYVWREAAAQIRDWKKRFGISVPVSVNVSRIDMYDPDLIRIFRQILEDYDLEPGELLLEITESAYTQDSEQIIHTVNELRELGFKVEMDDFGTGYSSLNMISSLPIDALKLDMQFIRSAFREGGNTRLIEIIVDIARYLGVPTIAEGVETAEQLVKLRELGCDLVQGFYFSRPVPATEYETFIDEKKKSDVRTALAEQEKREPIDQEVSARISSALTSGFEVIYYVNTETGHYVEFSAQGRYQDLQIDRSGSDFFGDTQLNIPRVVHREDQERVALSLQREALRAQLLGGGSFTMTYRLVIDGTAVYYNLRAVNAGSDDHHIVIGVSNVHNQVREAREQQESSQKNHEFFAIAQALSSDFESIYYVDTITDDYTEFTAQGSYEKLQIEQSGGDFFRETQKNIQSVVYEEDLPLISSTMEKDSLLQLLRSQKIHTVIYRLLIDETPTYYQMKIVMAEDQRHLVIGVTNIETQILREQMLEASRQNSLTYASIAQALAADYFSIYYVDINTDRFVEFSARDDYSELGIEKGGEDFFNLSRRNILRIVHPEDHDMILSAFTKEKLLDGMKENGTFTLEYRLMFGDTPQYVSLKATRMTNQDDHIVIGVNSIDAQMRRQEEFEAVRRQTMTYSRVAQALSQDYFSIYLVNTETDEFIEYSATSEYQELHVEQSGEDFFEDCRRNVMRLVHPEDLNMALAVWEKSRLMPELEDGKTFSSIYRLMFDDTPVYINCKVIRLADEEDGRYIVIGISNVDAQMKRERELHAAREKVNRDALTGVKSKNAYIEASVDINRGIEGGTAAPFAIAVCDVNGLKKVNDTQGHAAGDKLIQEASHEICDTFKHSPVYRIGGDEFVAILRGSDYEQRHALAEIMSGKNDRNKKSGGVIVACGLAERTEGDRSIEEVFERADAAMYENKSALKI